MGFKIEELIPENKHKIKLDYIDSKHRKLFFHDEFLKKLNFSLWIIMGIFFDAILNGKKLSCNYGPEIVLLII